MHNITKVYYNAALELGFGSLQLVDEMAGFTISLGKRHYHFRGGFTPFNSISSVSIGMNKYVTNKILEAAGIPVPKATVIKLNEFVENNNQIADLNYPVVAKPCLSSACGRDVVCNIKSPEGLLAYLKETTSDENLISVEEYHPGLRSYRVLVFYGKVIGVVERIPAHVVGDGIKSIRSLIREQNIIRKKLKETIPTGPIRINEETRTIFQDMGITLKSVPEKGQVIPIRYICNSTFGGTFYSYKPDIICKENAELASRAAAALDLNLAGFDVLCENIGTPIAKSRGFFIEVNIDPDITIHENGFSNTKVSVSKVMLKKLIAEHPFHYITSRYPLGKLYKIGIAACALVAFIGAMITYV